MVLPIRPERDDLSVLEQSGVFRNRGESNRSPADVDPGGILNGMRKDHVTVVESCHRAVGLRKVVHHSDAIDEAGEVPRIGLTCEDGVGELTHPRPSQVVLQVGVLGEEPGGVSSFGTENRQARPPVVGDERGEPARVFTDDLHQPGSFFRTRVPGRQYREERSRRTDQQGVELLTEALVGVDRCEEGLGALPVRRRAFDELVTQLRMSQMSTER